MDDGHRRPSGDGQRRRADPYGHSAAPCGGDSLDAEVFLQRAVHLVASPTPGTPLYLGTRNGRVYALASDGQWAGPVVRGGLQAPVFVG